MAWRHSKRAVAGYVAGEDWTLVAEFEETESGKRNDRVKLNEALRLCRQQKAKLIIAKLDSLARNVAFISTLMKSKVEFAIVDMPSATKFTIHIMAAVAEQEAEAISKRTKAALAAAKARGTVLVGRRVSAERMAEIGAAARAERSERVKKAAVKHIAVIDEIRAAGATTLRAIAAGLNERAIDAPRGGQWSSVQVMRVLAKAG